jgi:NitT/TauT family transport system permease protein
MSSKFYPNKNSAMPFAVLPPLLLLVIWAIVAGVWPGIIEHLRSNRPGLAAVFPDLTFLSSPSAAGRAFVQMVVNGTLAKHAVLTSSKTLAAFALAAIVGGLLGWALAMRTVCERLLLPSVEALRSIPPIALLPLFILFAGVGSGLAISFAFFGSMWPVTVAAYAALKSVNPTALHVARNLRLNQRQLAKFVVVPLALPGYLTGLRIALPLSLILVIVSEMLSGDGTGLGAQIDFAKRSFYFDEMIALIFAVAMLGLLLNWSLGVVERKVLFWDARFRNEAK